MQNWAPKTAQKRVFQWKKFWQLYFGENHIPKDGLRPKIALLQFSSRSRQFSGGLILELSPIYVLLLLFFRELANSSVQFHCNNLAAVQIRNNQTNRSPTIMRLLKPMICTMLKYNGSFRSVHIPGLSRVSAMLYPVFRSQKACWWPMIWNVALPLSHNGCVHKTSGSMRGVATVLSSTCHPPRLPQKLVQAHGCKPFLCSTHIYKDSVVICTVHALFWNERGHQQSSPQWNCIRS